MLNVMQATAKTIRVRYASHGTSAVTTRAINGANANAAIHSE